MLGRNYVQITLERDNKLFRTRCIGFWAQRILTRLHSGKEFEQTMAALLLLEHPVCRLIVRPIVHELGSSDFGIVGSLRQDSPIFSQ